ncbi:hypothetical protein GWK16_03890 [Roseomonas sp. JC162]|uniref:Uncharacterized protein n=1 Tax=Neoroseomonas marina TaxID=1232220 RepID=A0A848EAR0_9PROT|nr:hypothetical protein [Neoroseomonas marina]NMJ40368.1 hypothetical protein [Neoroseomonas marina]
MHPALRGASCAAALSLLGLAACTVNNPPPPAPVVVQEPMRSPTVVQPGTTAIVPPGSVIVPPSR